MTKAFEEKERVLNQKIAELRIQTRTNEEELAKLSSALEAKESEIKVLVEKH